MEVKIVHTRKSGYYFANSSHFLRTTPISEPLLDALPSLFSKGYFPFSTDPLLIVAGTGAGKTRSVLEVVVPFAVKCGLTVCFISSRAAIGSQFKRSLAHQLGQKNVLREHTPFGLRRLSQIGPVRILTFHALWAAMCTHQAWIEDVDILVFDEIQSLTLDAPFVPFTGQLMQRLPKAFAKAVRIYMSATPEPILDALLRAEGNERLQVLQWPVNFDAFRLHFFSTNDSVIQRLNALPDDDHALVFVPSITEGERMKDRLTKPCRLISAKTKDREPEIWSQLLDTQMLDKQIVLATTTLDAGVSLSDPALKHIFCTGLNAAAVIQQAGRKRLKTGEKLNLYLWSPPKNKLASLLHQRLEVIAALALSETEPYQFFRDFILGDTMPQVRKMCTVSKGPSVQINSLAAEFYLQERDLLLDLLDHDSDYPLDQHWCNVFGQDTPSDASRWLDTRKDEYAQTALHDWLLKQVGLDLSDKDARASFGQRLKQLYYLAFGPRSNDRSDRSWGLSVMKKVLADLPWGFAIDAKGRVQQIDRPPP